LKVSEYTRRPPTFKSKRDNSSFQAVYDFAQISEIGDFVDALGGVGAGGNFLKTANLLKHCTRDSMFSMNIETSYLKFRFNSFTNPNSKSCDSN